MMAIVEQTRDRGRGQPRPHLRSLLPPRPPADRPGHDRQSARGHGPLARGTVFRRLPSLRLAPFPARFRAGLGLRATRRRRLAISTQAAVASSGSPTASRSRRQPRRHAAPKEVDIAGSLGRIRLCDTLLPELYTKDPQSPFGELVQRAFPGSVVRDKPDDGRRPGADPRDRDGRETWLDPRRWPRGAGDRGRLPYLGQDQGAGRFLRSPPTSISRSKIPGGAASRFAAPLGVERGWRSL